MHRHNLFPSLLSLSLLACGLTFACSSSEEDPQPGKPDPGEPSNPDDGSGSCRPANSCPVDVSGVDLDAPVSFERDVMPVFQRSCNDNACHGHPQRAFAGLYLGPAENPTSEQLDSVYQRLVSEQPTQLSPTARNVVPGDWKKSFLLAKIDGCQNDGSFECPGNTDANLYSFCEANCGDGMPQLTEDGSSSVPYPISEEDRHTIRRWIHQGAPQN